jgi:hypothetical protein
MKLGAERKKLIWLGAIVVFGGGYAYYSNLPDTPSAPSRPVSHSPVLAPVAPIPLPAAPATQRKTASSHSSEEFRPSLKPKRAEDRIDPMTIDPTLRLDLLAKVQGVEIEGGGRNLFQLSAPPPPPAANLPPEPKVTPGQMASNQQPGSAGPPVVAPPPAAPPPPPITLKYYGYSSTRGDARKRAFFLDGDEILVGAEGDLVKKRYRVVRIGVNSVVMEDTQFKHEQTLPLQEENATG